mmetsp:Transcript_24230/g.52267  ORF Transcript_24230/g.52267 Transcript_24230/m.52267 type:complete len:668 (-) Transcript_24230:95-2098(-)
MASSSSSSTTTPHFRLLLHGQDGSIPYLTPALTRLFFCPNEDDCTDNATSTSSSDDWKWRRQHFILGVAVKDTCVTAVYREASSKKKKKKRKKNDQDGGGGDMTAKRAKNKQSSSSDDAAPVVSTSEATVALPSTAETETMSDKEGDKSTNNEQAKKNEDNAKKPAGYTFLAPSQSSTICTEINSRIVPKDSTSKGEKDSPTYMQTHLRIPRYISTMIVPTFSLYYPDNTVGPNGKEGGIEKINEKEDKKHEPRKQLPHQKPMKQKQQQQKKDVIPNSTKDSMPVDTPHGWQKLRPEQYWDAVLSLLARPSASPADSSAAPRTSLCEGAVGLFDHMGITTDHINYLFAEFMKNNGGSNDDASTVLTPQAQKALLSPEGTTPKGKWDVLVHRLVQRTNDWSYRTQEQTQSSTNFWTPVQMAASQLPLNSLFARGSKPRSQGDAKQQMLSNCSNAAIVGWDAISYNREFRRQALRNLMTTIQSSPTPAKQYLLLSVNDLQSMLDAAREGVSIIGTDLVRQWSRTGKALCLDLTFDGNNKAKVGIEDKTTLGGKMDLKDVQYARDSLALLPGCKCLACRPRQKNAFNHNSSTEDQIKVPSFTRAYIHHLIKAKEMLAESLLFIHNLHQTLLLFRQLSKAVSLDEGIGDASGEEGKKKNLEAFCQKIEEQL